MLRRVRRKRHARKLLWGLRSRLHPAAPPQHDSQALCQHTSQRLMLSILTPTRRLQGAVRGVQRPSPQLLHAELPRSDREGWDQLERAALSFYVAVLPPPVHPSLPQCMCTRPEHTPSQSAGASSARGCTTPFRSIDLNTPLLICTKFSGTEQEWPRQLQNCMQVHVTTGKRVTSSGMWSRLKFIRLRRLI